jgi:polyphenol oxidase
MDLVRSSLLSAFPHGFTTRRGGVSPPPWDDLNLGGAVGDAPANVVENWRRLEIATGLLFARVQQVHGSRVVRLDAPTVPTEEADAVITTDTGVAACVSVADCVPLLLADPVTGAVCAVHAGWRGTLAHAAAEGVRALGRITGAPPTRLLAAIGPSIGPCCYEVSRDVAGRFRSEIGVGVVDGASPRVDLRAANRRILEDAGVARAHVDVLDRCTSCEPGVFFSHRRDAGRTGRQMAFIAPHPPTAGGTLP